LDWAVAFAPEDKQAIHHDFRAGQGDGLNDLFQL